MSQSSIDMSIRMYDDRREEIFMDVETITFTKMTGAGNDFVLLDNRAGEYSAILTTPIIAALCDRRFGVGADGLIALEVAEGGVMVRMRYYNADGGEAEMCGNGARCFARFSAGIFGREQGGDIDELNFETMAGLISATVLPDGNVTIGLTKPHSLSLNAMPPDEVVPVPVHSLNTGVPHAVVFLPDIEGIDVAKLGAHLRYHATFAPAGTNANFVQILGADHLAIRTYERGVEGETLACGTGMTACALIHAVMTGGSSPILVDVAGGATLQIGFERVADGFDQVTLTGPADFVFTGQTKIENLKIQ